MNQSCSLYCKDKIYNLRAERERERACHEKIFYMSIPIKKSEEMNCVNINGNSNFFNKIFKKIKIVFNQIFYIHFYSLYLLFQIIIILNFVQVFIQSALYFSSFFALKFCPFIKFNQFQCIFQYNIIKKFRQFNYDEH